MWSLFKWDPFVWMDPLLNEKYPIGEQLGYV